MHSRFVLFALLSSLLALAAPAAELPETPAGEELAVWLQTVRSGDEAQLRTHFNDRFEPAFRDQLGADGYVQFSRSVAMALSDVDPARIIEAGPRALRAFFQTAAGWIEVQLSISGDESQRIDGLLVRPGAPPEERPAGSPKAEAPTSLQEVIDLVRNDGEIPGMVAAVVDSTGVLEQAASGIRAVGSADAVTTADLFHIGSVTKSITSTLIGALIEADLLSLSATLDELLPGFPMHEGYRSATLEHLLQHRAGIEPALQFDDAGMKRWTGLEGTAVEQRAAFLREVLAKPPRSAPGTRHEYSNAGYALAGHIAEQITESDWETQVRRRVFEPLGMKDAGFGWPATAARPGQPRGHYGSAGGKRAQGLDEYPLGDFIDPAGDVHCTIGDLGRFASFHLAALGGTDGVLSAETVRRLHTPPAGQQYAAGWLVTTTPTGEQIHMHNGSVGTFFALVVLVPEKDRAYVLAANSGDAEPAMLRAVKLLAE